MDTSHKKILVSIIVAVILIFPFFTHFASAYAQCMSWKTNASGESDGKVVTVITNNCWFTVTNVHVENYWDASHYYGPNHTWTGSSQVSDPFSMNAGAQWTITEYIKNPPVGYWTRVVTEVWSDNAATQTEYGDWVGGAGGGGGSGGTGESCGYSHMSISIPTYAVKAFVALDDGQTAWFSGTHIFLVSPGNHYWAMDVYYPADPVPTVVSETSYAPDCRSYSYVP